MPHEEDPCSYRRCRPRPHGRVGPRADVHQHDPAQSRRGYLRRPVRRPAGRHHLDRIAMGSRPDAARQPAGPVRKPGRYRSQHRRAEPGDRNAAQVRLLRAGAARGPLRCRPALHHGGTHDARRPLRRPDPGPRRPRLCRRRHGHDHRSGRRPGGVRQPGRRGARGTAHHAAREATRLKSDYAAVASVEAGYLARRRAQRRRGAPISTRGSMRSTPGSATPPTRPPADPARSGSTRSAAR